MSQPKPTPAKEIRITALPAFCEVHGWKPGGIYPTVMPLTDYTDENGQNIYVLSTLRNYSVWLSPGNYELVTNQNQ